jgi:hypothetical protein
VSALQNIKQLNEMAVYLPTKKEKNTSSVKTNFCSYTVFVNIGAH